MHIALCSKVSLVLFFSIMSSKGGQESFLLILGAIGALCSVLASVRP